MDELISREVAIEVGLRLCGRDTKMDLINLCEASIADSEGRAGGILDYIGELEDLPSAQPETAKRIVGKSRDGMTLWYQCDMCNEHVDAQDNFCSGCGRRLVNE